MQEYKENIKNIVWALIKMQNEFSFKNLMKSTNLSFIELSAIIGLLLQEKKISLYVNHIHTSDKRVHVSRQEDLFFQFMKLLSDHITSERSVTYYASQLCITPKYLSTVVKLVSGKTPTDWIREKLIDEMKYRLCHSQATIKEIAFQLHFPNNSFFGKYFKAATGVSPTRFRLIHCNNEL